MPHIAGMLVFSVAFYHDLGYDLHSIHHSSERMTLICTFFTIQSFFPLNLELSFKPFNWSSTTFYQQHKNVVSFMEFSSDDESMNLAFNQIEFFGGFQIWFHFLKKDLKDFTWIMSGIW